MGSKSQISIKSTRAVVNLKTVATLAGVSIATVSRVLNGDAAVKDETRIAVQRAIKSSGYHPNRVAQRLRSSTRTRKLVGLLIPDIQNPFYVEVIRGIEEYAYQNGSAVVIGNFSQSSKREKLYIDILRSESVDGFIVAPHEGEDKYVEELLNEGHPLVCIDRGLSNGKADVVKSDNDTGAFVATEHLIKLGHSRIAFIAGDPAIPTTQERINGYRMAFQRYGLNVDENLIIGKKSDFASGVEIMGSLLDLPEPPTAVFTSNNLLTLGALEMIHSRSLQIPKDIAIVGFDDVYWATSLNPSLTAVRQHGFEIGRHAMELLYRRMVDPSTQPVNLIVKTELMVRKSCGFQG